MKFSHFTLLGALGSLLCASPGAAADECQPSTWEWNPAAQVAATGGLAAADPPKPSVEIPPQFALSTKHNNKPPEPGEINCRYWGRTYDEADYYSCFELAETYGITIEKFWMLNPQLAPDCEGIEPHTEYCVSGFIEPLRSTDGFCGPLHQNATCLGTDFGQCCNAETWKCGETLEDCAAGTCYEGACPGHAVYTTDGKCGYAYGFTICAGKWGDCCSIDGECGTGAEFCGDRCQSGNCTAIAPTRTELDGPLATGGA